MFGGGFESFFGGADGGGPRGEVDNKEFYEVLGVDRNAPVGIVSLGLNFQLASPADDSQLSKLVELTERYCVVLRTLAEPATVKAVWTRRV